MRKKQFRRKRRISRTRIWMINHSLMFLSKLVVSSVLRVRNKRATSSMRGNKQIHACNKNKMMMETDGQMMTRMETEVTMAGIIKTRMDGTIKMTTIWNKSWRMQLYQSLSRLQVLKIIGYTLLKISKLGLRSWQLKLLRNMHYLRTIR